MGDTMISWCDKVWNPVTGCAKCAIGCENCYAEAIAKRFWGKQYGGRKFTEVRCHPDRLEQPFRWRKPSTIFVDSMGDLYHEDVPFEFIDQVKAIQALTPQHTYIELTKRGERMAEYHKSRSRTANYWKAACPTGHTLEFLSISLVPFPLPNVWLGVSVSTQADLDKQVPPLLRCPAAVRILSLEPLLQPINVNNIKYRYGSDGWLSAFNKEAWPELGQVHWVIVGCESGPKRREFDLDWPHSIRGQCAEAGVPFFLKQIIVKGKVSKDPSEWPADLQNCQQFPKGQR